MADITELAAELWISKLDKKRKYSKKSRIIPDRYIQNGGQTLAMQISNTDRPKNYTSHGNTSAKRHPAGHNFPAVQITALLFQNSVPRQVFTFYNAFLLPGSVQQMDFCVNGRGFASSLRRSIDTKIHLLLLAPKQKSLIVNTRFIPFIFYSTGFSFP